MKKIHILFLAILISVFQLSAFGQDGGRTLAATWQVQKYDLDATLPQGNVRTLTARAVIYIRNVSGKPATSLTLRLSSMAEVGSMKINGAVVDFSKNEEKVNSVLSLQRIVTRFPSVAADLSLTVAVEYKISLKDNTALGSVSPVASQFLPLSYWYPTPNSWFFSRGPDLAAFQIKITPPAGQAIVSSGIEAGGGFDQKLHAQPFFLAGSWEISNQNGVSVYLPKETGSEGQKRAAELATLLLEARTYVAAILGKAPDMPLRMVSVRRGAGFASGGTILVDEAVFRRGKVDSLTAMNIAEAAVKTWLGNSVDVNGEGYGIIAEGLSRYLATQFIESKFGKDVADIERLRQRTAYSAVSKRDAPMSTVSPIDDYYFQVVANKGAMVWRILAKKVGSMEFAETIRKNMQDGNLNITELRSAFSPKKELLDYLFDQVTDMNLQAGLPQINGAETRVSLRNTGAVDVEVDISATTATGEKIISPTTIKAASYSEVSIRTNSKVVRTEIDPDKFYPQIEYSDDVGGNISGDNDPLLTVKRSFDKQKFDEAESMARASLNDFPRFDDLRILLGRALLAQNKNVEAEKEFRAVMDEKLPTARSLAWASIGLAEVSGKTNKNDAALKFAENAILIDADYGASFAARNLRNKLGAPSATDAGIKTFFADFDKAATANRKADVDALALPGEVSKFVSGVAGSTTQWQTEIRQIDRLDANSVLVETAMTVKLLNKEVETGIAVYRLTRVGNSWKLSAVDMFEVR